MEDKKIRLAAKITLNVAARLTEPTSNYYPIFKENSILFQYSIECPSGIISGSYDPLPAVESMFREFLAAENDAAYEKKIIAVVTKAVLEMLKHFPTKMKEALYENARESLCEPTYELLESNQDKLIRRKAPYKYTAHANQFLNTPELEKRRRKRVGVPSQGSGSKMFDRVEFWPK